MQWVPPVGKGAPSREHLLEQRWSLQLGTGVGRPKRYRCCVPKCTVAFHWHCVGEDPQARLLLRSHAACTYLGSTHHICPYAGVTTSATQNGAARGGCEETEYVISVNRLFRLSKPREIRCVNALTPCKLTLRILEVAVLLGDHYPECNEEVMY